MQPVRLVVAPVAALVVLLLRLAGRLLARRVAPVLLPLAARLLLPRPASAGRLLLPLHLVVRLPRLHLMLVGLPRRLPVTVWSVSA